MCLLGRWFSLFAIIFAFAGRSFAADGEPQDGLHYRPANAAFADAIPFYHDGTYHVFYLRSGQGGTPWAHISSRDLLNWREHPDALTPGKPDEPDGDCVFTGSIIERDGVFHAFYTGWNPRHPTHREQIMHATSDDLVMWAKQSADTFHADGKIYQDNRGEDFRDPLVFWNDSAGEYWMLLWARRNSDGQGVTGRYTSKDLTHWQPAEPLDYNPASECPDIFQIGDRWYHLVSFGAMHWASADDPGKKWTTPERPFLDTPMLYAAKRLFDGKRHIAFGFVRDQKDRRDLGGREWGGTMCLPRELYRNDAGELCTRPAAEITAAFSKKWWSLDEVKDLTGADESFTPLAGEWQRNGEKLVGRGDVVAATVRTPADYMLECRAKPTPIGRIELGFRTQGPHHDGYRLIVDLRHQSVEIRGPLHVFERRVHIPWDQPVRVQAFVVGSIIECFVNDCQAFTCRAYDHREGDLFVSIDDGGGAIKRLDIHELPSQLPRKDP